MILLDTNVLSELTRTRPAPQVVAWLEENEPRLALPAITLAELRYGIARLDEGRRKSSLTRFWNMTRERFVGRIYSFDDRAAEACGDMVATAERTGTPINVADGLIAAIVRNPVKVITRSTLNVIIDSTVSDHLTERSDAGVRL